MQAVAQNGESLEWASKELQNDKEVVVIAVSDSTDNLDYASETLIVNDEWIFPFLAAEREILVKCLSINGLMLK